MKSKAGLWLLVLGGTGLVSYLATRKPTAAGAATANASNILRAQQTLGQLDYYNGPQNGQLSAEFLNALDQYQVDRSIPQTGTLDAATLASLNTDESGLAAGGASLLNVTSLAGISSPMLRVRYAPRF